MTRLPRFRDLQIWERRNDSSPAVTQRARTVRFPRTLPIQGTATRPAQLSQEAWFAACPRGESSAPDVVRPTSDPSGNGSQDGATVSWLTSVPLIQRPRSYCGSGSAQVHVRANTAGPPTIKAARRRWTPDCAANAANTCFLPLPTTLRFCENGRTTVRLTAGCLPTRRERRIERT